MDFVHILLSLTISAVSSHFTESMKKVGGDLKLNPNFNTGKLDYKQE
jgi:hypothetical protein